MLVLLCDCGVKFEIKVDIRNLIFNYEIDLQVNYTQLFSPFRM
jgi:hypothetical protein